jgi:hypothetical protein
LPLSTRSFFDVTMRHCRRALSRHADFEIDMNTSRTLARPRCLAIHLFRLASSADPTARQVLAGSFDRKPTGSRRLDGLNTPSKRVELKVKPSQG